MPALTKARIPILVPGRSPSPKAIKFSLSPKSTKISIPPASAFPTPLPAEPPTDLPAPFAIDMPTLTAAHQSGLPFTRGEFRDMLADQQHDAIIARLAHYDTLPPSPRPRQEPTTIVGSHRRRAVHHNTLNQGNMHALCYFIAEETVPDGQPWEDRPSKMTHYIVAIEVRRDNSVAQHEVRLRHLRFSFNLRWGDEIPVVFSQLQRSGSVAMRYYGCQDLPTPCADNMFRILRSHVFAVESNGPPRFAENADEQEVEEWAIAMEEGEFSIEEVPQM